MDEGEPYKTLDMRPPKIRVAFTIDLVAKNHCDPV
jgi:hypothetical protein